MSYLRSVAHIISESQDHGYFHMTMDAERLILTMPQVPFRSFLYPSWLMLLVFRR
ncbi:hypothetical protein DL93DRAFT_2090648 [Clavulina sp. PMI_390]|nr:hypothetical protein DL93DRAFT_2090648 [Clavulina sp. PMI_390]